MRLTPLKFVTVMSLTLVTSVSYAYGGSRKRTFTANTNFENTMRWDDTGEHAGLPCAGDRILFAPDDVISVFVQTGTTISEMVLPLNGEYIFGDGFAWGVSNDLSPCSHIDDSHDVHFNSAPDSWFRPSNWKPSSQNVNISVTPQDLLDIAKIPCDFDDVIYSDSSSSTTEIEIPVTVRSLRVAGKTFGTDSFSEYRKSEGKYRFIGTGDVTIKEEGCQDPTGCLCRGLDNLETVFNAICGYIECEQVLACESPIMGYGSCCKRCANGTTDDTTRSMTDATMDGVAIQIYVTDDAGTGERAKALTNAYYNILKSRAIISQGLDAGAIAGTVVGSLFGVLLIAIVLYGCRSVPFFGGKKYNMEFELDDANVANITEVGPGEEFESSDYDRRIKANQTTAAETVGWPQRSAIESDFGVSFGNPAFEEHDM